MKTKKVLSAVNDTDKAMVGGVGKTQSMLANSIRSMEKRIINLYKDLETTGSGDLIGPRVNLAQAQKIHKDLIKIFEEEYGKGVRRAVSGYNGVAKLIQTEFKELGISADYTAIDRDMINTLKEQSYSEYTQFGNAARDQISQTMYDTVAGGGSFADLVATTKGILMGGLDAKGRSMAAYATQWANDGIMNFHQSVTLTKAADAGLTSFLYYGDIMKTSRAFCIDRVGKVFSRKQIESWNDISWSGKAGPPLTYRGGYNCRHHWHPVDPEWVPEEGIPLQDIYKEQGIDKPYKAGATVPPWPAKPGGGVNTKKAVKKIPTEYKDKYNRWVPITDEEIDSPEGQAWLNNMMKEGEAFSDYMGLGPCAPTADNMVQVLRARGINARTMFTHYAVDVKKFDGYPHYVAVEIDDAGDVIKIWDPTNPNRPLNKRITKVKKGKAPREYFATPADDNWRDVTEVFDEGQMICGPGGVADDLYLLEERQWFYGKMDKPKVPKGKPKGALPPPKKFTPAKTPAEGAKVTDSLVKGGNDSGYILNETGIGGKYPVRYNHSAQVASFKKLGRHEYQKAINEKLYGKSIGVKTLPVQAVNLLNEHLMEFDTVAGKLGIPAIRSVRVGKSASAGASMGDGVLFINKDNKKWLWKDITPEMAQVVAKNMEESLKVMKAKAKALAKTNPKLKATYDLNIKRKEADLVKIKQGHVKGLQPAKKFSPNQLPADRPHSSSEYYDFSDDKFLSTLWHETGHHVHQQLFVKNAYDYNSPFMETWLGDFVKEHKLLGPTRYGDTNGAEFFAENYSLWKMGLKDRITPGFRKAMQGVQDLEDGKITIDQLQENMVTGVYDP